MSDKFNLIDTIAKDEKFSTFTRLLRSSKATGVFDGEGPFTIFAPTNDAFAKIPDVKISELINETNQRRLKTLLSYHIMPGKVMAANLISASSRKAVTGQELMFTDVNGVKVNGASIQARNLEASNGVIHAVDTVLAPSTEPRFVTPPMVPVAMPDPSAATDPPVTSAAGAGSVTQTAIPTNGKPPAGSPIK